MEKVNKNIFWFLIIALIGLRLLHLGEHLDAPHDWRQSDTAYYIWDFYKNGIDLFYPAVCWMGGHEVVALEFPLPEAFIALFYHIFGDSIPMARGIFLLFFCGAAYYLYRITDLVFDTWLAMVATLVFLAMPLGLFYSRAIHIDFSVIFLSHGLMYFALKGIRTEALKWIIISSLFAIPSFLIKAPYVFYLALPIIAFAIQEKKILFILKVSVLYIPALLLFWLWQKHVYAINSAAPDWDYILHYRKFDDNTAWYFGSLQQRLQAYNWWVVAERWIYEAVGLGGIPFFAVGFFCLFKEKLKWFLISWGAGLVLYLMIFFNLNFVHNYYQIPFLAPTAIILALGFRLLYTYRKKFFHIGFILFILINIVWSEYSYYQVADDIIEIGQIIKDQIPEEALPIITYKKMDCRNPKIHYQAKRRGWSIFEDGVKPEVLQRLRDEEGATHWIYIGQRPLEKGLTAIPKTTSVKIIPLKKRSLNIYLYKF